METEAGTQGHSKRRNGERARSIWREGVNVRMVLFAVKDKCLTLPENQLLYWRMNPTDNVCVLNNTQREAKIPNVW